MKSTPTTPKPEACVHARTTVRSARVVLLCHDPEALERAIKAACAAWDHVVRDSERPSRVELRVNGRPHIGGGALAHQLKEHAVPRVLEAARASFRADGFRLRSYLSDPSPARPSGGG